MGQKYVPPSFIVAHARLNSLQLPDGKMLFKPQGALPALLRNHKLNIWTRLSNEQSLLCRPSRSRRAAEPRSHVPEMRPILACCLGGKLSYCKSLQSAAAVGDL